LYNYLKSVEPKILVLNGDIIDIWQFSTSYFPKAHWAVLCEIMAMAERGIPVYYLTGNHDDTLRKFAPYQLGNVFLDNKLLLEVDGKLAWIFHGDVYDGSITHGRWMAKMGGRCYDTLIVFNRFINRILKKMNCRPTHFSKKIKSGVKKAVQKVSNFEKTAAEVAIENGYDYVICGHIHRPQMREVSNEKGSVLYLNSGDWLENLSALEYFDEQWHLYEYSEAEFTEAAPVRDFKISLELLLKSVQDKTVQEVLKSVT
jgi:UDP-2,3-diacylglucosamine pyrophosphatase LpxH